MVLLYTIITNILYTSVMWLYNIKFVTKMLFECSILLKLKELSAQYEKREINFYVIIKFINDNKKIYNFISFEVNCRLTRIESRWR